MTECNRCGACCEDISLGTGCDETVLGRLAADWEAWGDEAPDAKFILTYWDAEVYDEGEVRFTCQRFDPMTRLCTAHDERPPVCREFPWYGHAPMVEALYPWVAKTCSYVADIVNAMAVGG
jgi:Fe-S-cluster containining protein